MPYRVLPNGVLADRTGCASSGNPAVPVVSLVHLAAQAGSIRAEDAVGLSLHVVNRDVSTVESQSKRTGGSAGTLRTPLRTPLRLTAAVLGLLMLAGCSTAQPAPIPTPISLPGEPTATPTPVAKAKPKTPTPTPTPVPVATPFSFWPLSGIKAEGISPDDALLDRPAIAVKIDNSNRAKPQTNIQKADLVFEEIVEGGITRFMAVYQSQYPELVAPVRSGRNVDHYLVPMLSNGLILSGAAKPTYGTLHAAGIRTWEEGQIKGGFKRLKYRKAPHNLGVNLSVAGPILAAEGLQTPAKVWRIGQGTFSELGVPGLSHPQRITAAFSTHVSVTWTLDPQTNRWLRFENGKPHSDTESGQIWADNVIFLQAETAAGGGRDVSGNRTVDTTLVGTGIATIASHQDVAEVKWHKPNAQEPFVFTALNNVAVGVQPGVTWVELLPKDAKPVLHLNAE